MQCEWDNAELGVDALGYVIENRLLGKMFNKRLAAIGNLEICSGVSVSNIKPEPSGMKVTLEDGDAAEQPDYRLGGDGRRRALGTLRKTGYS